jgi:hypothetical protein
MRSELARTGPASLRAAWCLRMASWPPPTPGRLRRSGVPARGGRPPAMDSRWNGHRRSWATSSGCRDRRGSQGSRVREAPAVVAAAVMQVGRPSSGDIRGRARRPRRRRQRPRRCAHFAHTSPAKPRFPALRSQSPNRPNPLCLRGLPERELTSGVRVGPPRQGGGHWFEPSIAHSGRCRGFKGSCSGSFGALRTFRRS